ncbi:hypothetical protein [Duganella vulcania]|uniref:Uncharacterized protein n=1 Tax=Duganella vulcania TaxID=2692166 RepID=A0A845GH86_9BURK|nr:hypothetical protein [Duganella vulcania]MYM92656.1 hypothetical protein [Duganella vulcania]
MTTSAFDEMMTFHKTHANVHQGTWASEQFHQRSVVELQQLARDAELGRKLRELVGGGKFDLTDSPKSFVSTCVQLVSDQAAADQFSQEEVGLHAAGRCDEATCRVCAQNYPDIAAAARVKLPARAQPAPDA